MGPVFHTCERLAGEQLPALAVSGWQLAVSDWGVIPQPRVERGVIQVRANRYPLIADPQIPQRSARVRSRKIPGIPDNERRFPAPDRIDIDRTQARFGIRSQSTEPSLDVAQCGLELIAVQFAADNRGLVEIRRCIGLAQGRALVATGNGQDIEARSQERDRAVEMPLRIYVAPEHQQDTWRHGVNR